MTNAMEMRQTRRHASFVLIPLILSVSSVYSVGQTGESVTNSIGMRLIPIQPGTFTMGQEGPQTDYQMKKHPGESDRPDWDEKPVHKVVISKPFHIGATEVTVAEYRQFDPAFRAGKGLPDEAASGISWYKAVEFCAWRSKKEGKAYRLPTEAEWEYACRAGTTTVFHTGDKLPDGFLPWFTGYVYPGMFPWSFYFPDNKAAPEYLPLGPQAESPRLQSDGFPVPDDVRNAANKNQPLLRVAQRKPNAWGLYDMHGNLCEWCSDWYGAYVSGEQTDPRGRSDGDFRVFRDGPHSMLSRLVRSANRGDGFRNPTPASLVSGWFWGTFRTGLCCRLNHRRKTPSR